MVHIKMDSQDLARHGLERRHHLPPYSIICNSPWGFHLNDKLLKKLKMGISKNVKLQFSQF